MTGFRVTVPNARDLERRLRAYQDQTDRLVKQAVQAGAEEVQTDGARSIQQGPPRTGQVTTIGGKTHVRSAPGEPPKTDTGRLVGSIFRREERSGFAADVGTALDYGLWLEFGTKRMGARPWLKPALDRNKAKITARIARAMRR